MKKILCLLSVVFLFAQCRKDAIGVKLEYRDNFTIGAGLTAPLTYVFYEDIDLDVDFFIDGEGITRDQVINVNPYSARLIVRQGSFNLDFIDRVEVYISPKGAGPDVPSSQKRQIFYHDEIPFNSGGNLELFPTLLNVKEEVFNEEFQLDIELTMRGTTPSNIEMQIEYSFNATY